MKKFFIKVIELYQRTLSPDTGWLSHRHPVGYCKFNPTCSEYTKQAIMKYGSFMGISRGVWRVLRCNPWSKGGNDTI